MILRSRWERQMEHWRFRFGPPVVSRLIHASTWTARRRLRGLKISVMIDNNVLAHGVTHETGWISTGTSRWGGVVDVPSGYAARIPVHRDDDSSREYANIRFLPGIAQLALDGAITLVTSAELMDEQFRQPMGRFRGYGWLDYSVFRRVKIDSVDGYLLPSMGPTSMRFPSPKEQQQARIAAKGDGLYRELVGRLGNRNNLDAWHVRTAEAYGVFCLLTMDFKLRKLFEVHKHLEPIRSLRTKVLTPREFGQIFNLVPLSPRLLSYNDASFFVRSDLSSLSGKRRPLREYRRVDR
jgi:hypothetical protein